MNYKNLSPHLCVHIIHIIHLLYTQAIQLTTISGAVSSWYWTRNKSDFHKEHRNPVFHSLYRTLRFHLGSLAYGSFIISIIHITRLCLSYFTHRMKGLSKHSHMIKFVQCCAHCCLHCCENCGKYISNMGYIIVATKGAGFCSATRQAMMILIMNLSRVGIVHTFSLVLLGLGKLLVTLTCTFLLSLMVRNTLSKHTHHCSLFSFLFSLFSFLFSLFSFLFSLFSSLYSVLPPLSTLHSPIFALQLTNSHIIPLPFFGPGSNLMGVSR